MGQPDFWDAYIRDDALDALNALFTPCRRYLLYALEYANSLYPSFTPEMLDEFIATCVYGDAKKWQEEKHSNDCYGSLDFYYSTKYLTAWIDKQNPDDLTHKALLPFYQTYLKQTYLLSPKCSAYRDTLKSAKEARNKLSGHKGQWQEDRFTLEKFRETMELLESANAPFASRKDLADWIKARPKMDVPSASAASYWAKTKKELTEKFTRPPIPLEEVGIDLFSLSQLPEEPSLSKDQLNALLAACKEINATVHNDAVYYQAPQRLRNTLKKFLPDNSAAPQGSKEERLAQVEEEYRKKAEERQEMEAREAALSAPQWDPLPELQTARLKLQGSSLFLHPTVADDFLQAFTPLIDETMFLCTDGRQIIQTLQNAAERCKDKKKTFLPIDESVIHSIFHTFRATRELTPLELAALGENAAAEADRRKALHQNAKDAIKLLRHMRDHRTIAVRSSRTDSDSSRENLSFLVRFYPKVRFAVFTMDADFANSLGKVKGRNVVALKANHMEDNSLFLFRSTRENYAAMLSSQPPAPFPPEEQPRQEQTQPDQSQPEPAQPVQSQPAPAPDTPTAAPKAPGSALLHSHVLPRQGDAVMAKYPDGSLKQVVLRHQLGEGGEGTVYATNFPGLAAKIYIEKRLTRSRLDKLTKMLAGDPHIDGLCWPQALLYNSKDEWVGFLMPQAQGMELTTLLIPGRDGERYAKMGWTRLELTQAASNIAGLFAALHSADILMGDVNRRNIMVDRDTKAYFLDCDSYQFGSEPCPVGMPLYTSPEVHRLWRAKGGQNYEYLRTETNERYSVAVILFEVLMLGSPPYLSRGNSTDSVSLIQAIIDGVFPYPYRGDEGEDEEEDISALPPVGNTRYIWSHFPYRLKTDFYNVFTGKERPPAAKWRGDLENYVSLIRQGKSASEIMLYTFKVVSREGEEVTRMVDLVCGRCQQKFNLAEDVYARRLRAGEIPLCGKCREQDRVQRNRPRTLECYYCHRPFLSSDAEWLNQAKGLSHPICPDCEKEDLPVVCSRRGRHFHQWAGRTERQFRTGQPILCKNCYREVENDE